MSKPLEIRSQPIDGTTLCVQFFKHNDRFAHRIYSESTDCCVELLRSVEGTSEDWPLSPPLQDIHAQDMGSGLVVMGVGMAGTGHWSATCQLKQTNEHVSFVFDIACRAKSLPKYLGSTYDGYCVDRRQEKADDFKCQYRVVSINGDEIEIVDLEGQPFWVKHTEAGIQQVRLLVFEEADAKKSDSEIPTSDTPQTYRWQYAIEFKPSVE